MIGDNVGSSERIGVMKLKINMREFTAEDSNHLYFLKGEYADGCILAFYSHSPCGNYHDQQRGWILIGTNKEILDEVDTYNWGATGEGRKVLKIWREKHSKLTYFKNKYGEYPWKMED